MADSPRKRQRLSPGAHKSSEDDVEGNSTESRNPTTPTRRASYLSPTKASLSRSHPDILAKSPKKGSLTESRGRLLRQELLSSRKNTRTSLFPTATSSKPLQVTNDSTTDLAHDDRGDKDGFAEAIAQSFPAIAPAQILEDDAHGTARSPLQTREPPNAVTSVHDVGQKSKPVASDNIPVPKLVTRQEVPARQHSEARNEPELPPTPVQLGLGMVPERPRGLASSSSIGSKSGSGKHRRRVRNSQTSAVTSSPLKPKATRPMSPMEFSDVEEIEHEGAEEAPESDVESDFNQSEEEVEPEVEAIETLEPNEPPVEIREKQTEGARLRFELQKVRDDFARVKSTVERFLGSSDPVLDDDVIQLLTFEGAKKVVSLQSPESHPLFASNSSAYLGLFIPAGLDLEHETRTRRIHGRPKVFHRLRIASTTSRFRNTLNLSLEVEIDAEDSRIGSLTVPKPKDRWESNNLDHWIEKRLATPLHKFDVGGIIYGASRYFEACITRAKILNHLDKRYNKGLDDDMTEQTQTKQNLTNQEVLLQVSLYLDDADLVVRPSNGQDSSKPTSTQINSKGKQVLLTYEIDLSWTGDVVNRVEICITGVSAKAQEGAMELFVKLLAAQGVIKAFDAVWGVLGWNTMSKSVDISEKRLGRPRKRIAS